MLKIVSKNVTRYDKSRLFYGKISKLNICLSVFNMLSVKYLSCTDTKNKNSSISLMTCFDHSNKNKMKNYVLVGWSEDMEVE